MVVKIKQNESALAFAAIKGEKAALQELLERNWSWLKSLVYSVAGGSELDDILQEVCLRVIARIGTLREPERFRPWLAVLARREALQYRRKLKRRPVPLSENIAEQQCDEWSGKLIESVEQAEQCRRILETAGRLPSKYREVFMLAHTQGMTYSQMSEVLEVPVTTVQIRLVRARRMIYEELTERSKVSEQ